MKAMEDWDPADRRPMILIGKTTKGYWPSATNGKIAGQTQQLVSYPSHPYAQKMNSDYFVALAKTFEDHYGVQFQGIRDGATKSERERLTRLEDDRRDSQAVYVGTAFKF